MRPTDLDRLQHHLRILRIVLVHAVVKRLSGPRERQRGDEADAATRFVIGTCHKHHRKREFLNVLKEIDARIRDDRDVHVGMDNDATYKAAQMRG